MTIELHSKQVLFCDWNKVNEQRLDLIKKLKDLDTTSSIFQQLNLAYVSQEKGRKFIKSYNEEIDDVSRRTEGKN